MTEPEIGCKALRGQWFRRDAHGGLYERVAVCCASGKNRCVARRILHCFNFGCGLAAQGAVGFEQAFTARQNHGWKCTKPGFREEAGLRRVECIEPFG